MTSIKVKDISDLKSGAYIDPALLAPNAFPDFDLTTPSGVNTYTLKTKITKEVIAVAVSDETTAITTGTAKVTFRMPYAMTLQSVRSNLNTASSSGLPTVDIKQGGTSVLSTLLSIDASAKTSVGATTPAVISTSSLTDDAEITIDITVAGTGAKGLKIYLIGIKA